MGLQKKKLYVVWFARKKITKSIGNRCNIASYQKNTNDLLKFFSNQKILNFLCTIYYWVLMENSFYFLLNGANSQEKN
jgi:hypothetical protein